MKAPTQKLTTPVAGIEIEIKDWITGEEAEYIDDALISKVDVKPDQRGKPDFGKFDVSAGLKEQVKREIEKFIVSADGISDKIVETIKALPEEDYQFIQNEIAKKRKKKVNQSEDTQQPQ